MIKIECKSDNDPFGPYAFTANWTDEEFRYHVWIRLRRDLNGERPFYPVEIEKTIYKNKIDDKGWPRYSTKKLDLTAKAHAATKAEIKRLAQYDDLMALYHERRAAHKAFDAMHAEASRLNAIFDAWRLLDTATVDEKMTLGLI